MKKNPPSMREVNAAEESLRNKARAKSIEGLNCPTWEEDKVWRKAHQSPIEKYNDKVDSRRSKLYAQVDEIILAGKMGQVTSEEFYNAVKSF